jgi:ABC-type sugar transport system substrate-binding protein
MSKASTIGFTVAVLLTVGAMVAPTWSRAEPIASEPAATASEPVRIAWTVPLLQVRVTVSAA